MRPGYRQRHPRSGIEKRHENDENDSRSNAAPSALSPMASLTATAPRVESRSGASLIGNISRWGLAALLGTSGSALLLAMTGLMTPWLVAPISLLATYVIARWLHEEARNPVGWPVAIAVLTLVVGTISFGWFAPHEHVLAGRDSGTYIATAAWVADQGGLWMDVGDPAFEGIPVVYESIGFPALFKSDHLNAQFLHIFPSLLAFVGTLFSDLRFMFAVTPVIAGLGLLALFVFARGMLSQWGALAATTLAAFTLPFVYFYRAPFSEMMAFAFVFGGLWALQEALSRSSLRLATGAGLMLGAVMLTRIDGVLVLLGLTAYITLISLLPEQDMRVDSSPPLAPDSAVLERAWKVAALLLFVAAIDGVIFAPAYLADHGKLVGAVLVVILALRFLGSRGAGLYQRHSNRIANGVAAVMGGYLSYAAIVRPSIEAPNRSDIYAIGSLQEAAGVAVEPLRTYAELSVRWLFWYLGIPLVMVGLVALVVHTRRLLLSRVFSFGPFVTIAAISTMLYIYRPSINPDHIWAMRRFLPLVIPALAILAIHLWEEVRARLGRWSGVGTLLVAVAFVIPVMATTANAGFSAEFDGAASDLEATCEDLGQDAVVVFVGEQAIVRSDTLAPILRGWCGIAVAAEDPQNPLDANAMNTLIQNTTAQNVPLWIIGDTPRSSVESVILFGQTYKYLEPTLFEAPKSWVGLSIFLTAGRPE